MEWNIVLADELEQLGRPFTRPVFRLGRKPPRLPVKTRISLSRKQILKRFGDRNIADRRIEPHVKYLVFVACLRNRNPPLQIARNCPLLKPVSYPRTCHARRIFRPAAGNARLFHPFLIFLLNLRKIDIQVLRLLWLRRGSAR